MNRLRLVTLAVLLVLMVSVIPARAQTPPCDAVSPTSGTVIAGQPMTLTVCYLDSLPAPTSWALYDVVGTAAAVRIPIASMTADAVTSATNGRQYTTTMTAPSTVGSVHSYTIAAVNATGEGPASLPFVSTVNPVPLPLPGVPTKLRVR